MKDERSVDEILAEWALDEGAQTIDLYHGTCMDSAKLMVKNGWRPNQVLPGGNQGQPRYLYVTTFSENAEWFANERGCDTVLLLKKVPVSVLAVDPEDGIGKNVQDELDQTKELGLPAFLVVTRPLPARHFKVYSGKY